MATRTTRAAAIVAAAERTQNVDSPARQQGQPGRNYQDDVSEPTEGGSGDEPSCTIKQLPPRLQFLAADVAARLNPVNEPVFGRTAEVPKGCCSPLANRGGTANTGPSRARSPSAHGDHPGRPAPCIVSHLNAGRERRCQFAGRRAAASAHFPRS